ncbi:MAG: DUF1828 domain-containing protein [Christensenellales bacterium]|jgi:hypothetical protein
MIEQILAQLPTSLKAEKTTENAWKILTPATFLNGSAISIYLEQIDGKLYLTDQKATLKYMNDLYDLKSHDVKMCISNVIKIYSFTIPGGKLLSCEITKENFLNKFYDFVMCIGSLANMFAFFDAP